ncbi:unnamed protein product [Effrenium voratum]|nr:unnamed protein product [Effrenium voratum]
MSRSLPAVNKRGSQVPVSRGSVLTSSRASLLPPIEATPSRPVKTRGSLQPDIPEGPGGVSPSGPGAFRRVSFSPTAADQQPEHIETTLSQLKLFKDMDSTVLKMLPEIVTSILCKAGTVLFKQGDPPGSCYVVIGGAVGVHVLSDEEGLPSNQPQEKHRFTTVKESGFLQDFLPGQRTVDGFSRYHEDTNFGNRLSQLGPGSVLGELALINDQPRLASAKCVEDSEFFVIRRNDFDNVLKEEMVKKGDEKLRFLMKHLPGMKEVPVPKPGGKLHASYMFKHAKFTRGHTFLVQGKIAEPHIWAVYKGSVEFRRAEVLSPEKAGEVNAACRSCVRGL